MKIIVDAFGGDNAPLEILKGCAEAVKELDIDILLTGSEAIEPPLDTVKLEKTVGAEYSGMKLHIEMVADGVQFAGAGYQKVNQNAILAAWGVDATVSPETGAITNVIYRS